MTTNTAQPLHERYTAGIRLLAEIILRKMQAQVVESAASVSSNTIVAQPEPIVEKSA